MSGRKPEWPRVRKPDDPVHEERARMTSAKTGRREIFALLAVALVLALGGFATQVSGLSGAPVTDRSLPPFPERAADAQTHDSHGAVSTSNAVASEVGAHILELGGNAVDAAVASAFALSVVEPHASGPGGGGGAMVSVSGAGEGAPVFIDFRDMADATGKEREDSFAVPGYVLGMERLIEQFGNLSLSEVIAPAIELADSGFVVSEQLAGLLNRYKGKIDVDESEFFVGQIPVPAGTQVIQPRAAQTLRLIADQGAKAFYEQVVTKDYPDVVFDWNYLRESLVVERTPVQQTIGGRLVESAPAPFGGSVLLLLLEYLNDSPARVLGSADVDAMVEYFDYVEQVQDLRRGIVADPAFGGRDLTRTDISGPEPTEPTEQGDSTESFDEEDSPELIDPFWQDEPIEDDWTDYEESITTTQISAVDKDGNAVSMTVTLGEFFGNGQQLGGFFSNESLHFAAEGINTIASYKKPRTFMSPTLITSGESTLAVGSPGGNRIPQIVTQFISADWALDSLAEAGETPRVVVMDGVLYFEEFQTKEVEERLDAAGFGVDYVSYNSAFFGSVNAIEWFNDGSVSGYADPRRLGSFTLSRDDTDAENDD